MTRLTRTIRHAVMAGTFFVLAIGVDANRAWGQEPSPGHASLRVMNARALPAELAVQRVSLGEADDYKPCIVRLDNGELLVVAFHHYMVTSDSQDRVREDMILFRSHDGGRTWSASETLPILGREPYFSLTRQGTLFVTVHLLDNDVRNQLGYVHSFLHRSVDRGKSWETVKLAAEEVPDSPAQPPSWVHTSRNVLELADGTLIFGVSERGVGDYLWRSGDGGKSWDRTTRATFEGVDPTKLWWPFMAETLFWQARNGDLLGIFRVDQKLFPAIPGTKPPQSEVDQFERLMVFRSRDGGKSWNVDRPLGSYYGEMYPALLRLADGRLLLTFTVRAMRPPLGVHAVLGKELADGFEFDFDHDRIVIDEKTPTKQVSGGGFGPTVQLDDGTLVTAYSYRDASGKTQLEVARWRLPAKDSAREQTPTAGD